MKIFLISLISVGLFAGVAVASPTTPAPSLSSLGKASVTGDQTQKIGNVNYNLKCQVWDYDNGYIQKCVVIGYSSGSVPTTKTGSTKLSA